MHIIGGKFKRRPLIAPKSEKVRPTTSQLREALFNICQLTIEGARFLDLFAGSGAMGLEALSRGATHATFVDLNRLSIAAIKKNIAALHVESQSRVFLLPALKAAQLLCKQNEVFDLIYADPPYGEGFSQIILEFIDSHPLLAPGGSLFIEDAHLHLPPLHTLKLQDQRTVGRAHLYEFT